MTTTILATLLDALGFDVSDPPVQTDNGYAVGWERYRTLLIGLPGTLLSVEHSMPALLRALARQYGAKLKSGEVPQWHREEPEGVWWLTWNDGQSQAFTPPEHDGWSDVSATVPALTADMGRLESLAAVIAWQVSR